MKRTISCKECISIPAPYFVGEWYKRIQGIAKGDMLCDWCGAKISKDDKCFAESMGLNKQGVPYYQWETEYIYPL